MLDTLTKKELVDLAATNKVEVDGRWAKDRIIATLTEAGVKPKSEDSSGAGELVRRVETAPVRFQAATGRIRIRDARTEITNWGPVKHSGLIVDFTPSGRPEAIVGGLSREFYPDLDEHDPEDEHCSCAKCLADVRDYIAADKHNVPSRFNVMETLVDSPLMPMPGWANVQAADIANLVVVGALVGGPDNDPVLNAARYEMLIGDNRRDVIAELERIADADGDDMPTSTDIIDAEVEV